MIWWIDVTAFLATFVAGLGYPFRSYVIILSSKSFRFLNHDNYGEIAKRQSKWWINSQFTQKFFSCTSFNRRHESFEWWALDFSIASSRFENHQTPSVSFQNFPISKPRAPSSPSKSSRYFPPHFERPQKFPIFFTYRTPSASSEKFPVWDHHIDPLISHPWCYSIRTLDS